jgi:hypothetical protein
VASIFDESVFAPVHTFMGAPQSWDLANAKAAVLGIPFDAGTHAVRHCQLSGPRAPFCGPARLERAAQWASKGPPDPIRRATDTTSIPRAAKLTKPGACPIPSPAPSGHTG